MTPRRHRRPIAKGLRSNSRLSPPDLPSREAAKALRIQSEALQGLSAADLKAEHAQAEEAEREEKADHMAQLQATVLAPIQEGMQAVPASEVR